MERLHKEWEALSERISSLSEQKINETRVEERLRLEPLIDLAKEERQKLEQEMLRLEKEAQADGTEVVDCAERIQQAMGQLSTRAFEISEVFPAIGAEFERLKKEGIRPEDERIFEAIAAFIENTLAPEAFIRFFKELDGATDTGAAGPDYAKLASRLQEGKVILCLGQDVGIPVPSTEQIMECLVGQEGFQGSLSELCERQEIAPDSGRNDLVEKIRAVLSPQVTHQIEIYEVLAQLDTPLLIISAAYDDLLEQALKERRKYVVIYPNLQEKKCLLRYSGQQGVTSCLPLELSDKKPLEEGYTVIYKLRGGFIDEERETLLLSERDYFTFTKFMEKKQFPAYLGNKLNKYALWFIGHNLQSWEERLVVKALQSLRDSRASALAVQEGVSDFSRDFWKDNKVDAYDLKVEDFVLGLKKEAVS
nr:SIR2 family protein [Candidatus Electrothrix aestuarii]